MARRGPQPLPLLSASTVASDEKLFDALDEVVLHMPGEGQRRRRILRGQQKLKALTGHEAWGVYLALEAATNERNDEQLIAVSRWAFAQGVASRSRGEDS